MKVKLFQMIVEILPVRLESEDHILLTISAEKMCTSDHRKSIKLLRQDATYSLVERYHEEPFNCNCCRIPTI
jgi:hypothetical protein